MSHARLKDKEDARLPRAPRRPRPVAQRLPENSTLAVCNEVRRACVVDLGVPTPTFCRTRGPLCASITDYTATVCH